MGIPGATGLKHAAKNMFGAVGVGIDAARGTSINWGSAMNIGSVGGLMTMGGAAGLGAVAGAGAGALMTQDAEGAAVGGLIGGAAGATALPAIGFAAGTAVRGADYMTRGGGIAKMGGGILSGAGSMAAGIGAMASNPSMLSPISRYGGVGRNIASNFATYTPTYMDYDAATKKLTKKGGLKLTGLGKGIIGAGAAVKGIRSGYEALENNRMGQMDPYVHRATPRLPSYANNAGASGDLVFAMNANRRG